VIAPCLRRWLAALALVLGCATAALAQPAAAPEAGDTIAVGLLERFPPFYSWDTAEGAAAGQPRGLDIDLLAEISRTTGVRFSYRRYRTFTEMVDALVAGQVRVITATAQTADRATYLRFTRPYASVQQAFVGPRNITSVPSTPDLSGRRVAVTKGFVSEVIAVERFPSAGRPAYATLDLALDALLRGETDFLLESAPTLRAMLAERKGHDLALLRTYGFPEGHMRLATAVPDTALAQQLDAALGAAEQAALKPLLLRWLPASRGPSIEGPPPADVTALRVGYLPADRPFTLRTTGGEADGIGIRMMREVAARAGVPLAGFEALSLGDGLAALRDGRLDVMLGLTDVAERRNQMTFVGPYRATPLVIVSRKQYSVWDLHQLAGQRLAMVKGYFATPYVRSAQPTIEVLECAVFDECLQMVERGEATAAVYGLQGAYERLAPRSASGLQITGTVAGLYDEHNLGVSLARASLAPRLRDALMVVQSEDMARIEADWARQEESAGVDWQRVRLGLGLAAAALLALAVGWWWHTRGLRREIARTEAARHDSDQYLAFMAHEVRNALQSVSGAVALLRGSSDPRASAAGVDRQRPLLDALGTSARSTLGLLNALLDRHRLHAGRLALELRAESIERVLRAVVDETAPAAEAKGLALAFDARTALHGWWLIDALRLQQIVRNLLVNSIKFSRAGRIVVAASLLAVPRGERWRQVVVEVSDQGPGMDAALLARTFERFTSQGGDRPGTGLGLHLCRDLAAALGGQLEVHSQPGQGSRFTLRFEAEAADDTVARLAEAGGRVSRLLVVEDSPVYSLLLRQAFENQGVAVTVAETLAQAREALIASVAGAGTTTPAFDLVLADTHLGDGTVDELLRFMREAVRPGVRLPPVVCMSAQFEEPMLARLAAAGAADLLTKDSDVALFARRVLAAPLRQAAAAS
jgi:two-component system, NarL family, sensor histidine kinase EvgS